MKLAELRKKSAKDLQKILHDSQEELSKIAREKRTSEQSDVRKSKNLRKTVARIKTIMNEDRTGEEK